jgi:ribosomal protein L37AE/L43A
MKTKTANSIKPVLAVVAIDRVKDFCDEEEVYGDWYKCPSCKNEFVKSVDNYCSNCGCKFEWSGYRPYLAQY